MNVGKAPTFAERWLKKFVSSVNNTLCEFYHQWLLCAKVFCVQDHCTGTGVLYDVVAHVPKSSLDPEARETLALIAARGESTEAADGESYIEKYTRGISEVESILALDRLRQVQPVVVEAYCSIWFALLYDFRKLLFENF